LASLPAAMERLERTNGGRVGVAIFNTDGGEHADYRGNERFPMCSTFKFLLAAAILQRVDQRREALERTIAIAHPPLLSHSPLTQAHAGGTMTIAALCHAIVTQSDNTAANLLLQTIGGPPGITTFARSIGDNVTRLDRTELALNESLEGDPRDTTSPIAMAGNLHTVLSGPALATASRQHLRAWMIACETGLDRLRANLPSAWHAGDKDRHERFTYLQRHCRLLAPRASARHHHGLHHPVPGSREQTHRCTRRHRPARRGCACLIAAGTDRYSTIMVAFICGWIEQNT
jgi:beta-lactamase class A